MSEQKQPMLLDLFCGAGGCSVGYARAGFKVVGCDVNLKLQKRYPYEFIWMNAIQLLDWFLLPDSQFKAPTVQGTYYQISDFFAIHASPPCQSHSTTRHLPNARPKKYGDCLPEVRSLLDAWGGTYVIENVKGAPMSPYAAELCGLSFGLKVFRHRLFESNVFLFQPPHTAHGERTIGKDGFCSVAGHGDAKKFKDGAVIPFECRSVAGWKAAMGIDWMVRDELAQAIPPAYTEYLGRQLMAVWRNRCLENTAEDADTPRSSSRRRTRSPAPAVANAPFSFSESED